MHHSAFKHLLKTNTPGLSRWQSTLSDSRATLRVSVCTFLSNTNILRHAHICSACNNPKSPHAAYITTPCPRAGLPATSTVSSLVVVKKGPRETMHPFLPHTSPFPHKGENTEHTSPTRWLLGRNWLQVNTWYWVSKFKLISFKPFQFPSLVCRLPQMFPTGSGLDLDHF